MVLLGVDPGLAVTGYGIIKMANSKFSLIEAGVIQTKKDLGLQMRLKEIYDTFKEILNTHPADIIIIEDLYTKYASPKTAILMGHARGVIFLAAAQKGIPIIGYTATQVKSSLTGTGRASKIQIQKVVAKFLNLLSVPQPPDVADALALTIAHAHTMGRILPR